MIDFGSTMKYYFTAPFGKWKIQKSEYEGKKWQSKKEEEPGHYACEPVTIQLFWL